MIIVTRGSITLSRSHLASAQIIDVWINGHQVWSTRIPEGNGAWVRIPWPAPLRPYLRGKAEIAIRDATSGRELVHRSVSLRGSARQVSVTDAQGRWLAMNKWDRLGPILSAESGVVERLLAGGQQLSEHLSSWGFATYLVGGSLLGLQRNGGLLPHDDDLDFAFLCEADNPADIGLTSYRMERQLVEAGYTVVRHSLAHLELVFFTSEGSGDFYIDIFTGFFYEDDYCQPFALKGPIVTRDDLLPVDFVELDGYKLPAPRHSETWLEYAYGQNWRIPDPTFKFETPAETRRRFETWFGVFNRARNFWDKYYLPRESQDLSVDAAAVSRDFLKRIPAGANVLDLGCGDGALASEIARQGHRVIGVDFSHEALRIARAHAAASAEFRYVNFNDRADLFQLGYQLLQTQEPWYVLVHQTLQGVTKENRKNIFWFFRQVLRGEAFAYLVADTTLSEQYQRANPITWHLPVDWQLREASGFGIEIELISEGERTVGGESRATATTVLRTRPKGLSPELLTIESEN